MKTLLLTSYGSRLGGGLYSTMTCYSQAMYNEEIEPVVVSFVDEFWEQDKIAYGNVRTTNYHRYSIPGIKQLGFSTDIHRIVREENADIIHQQGIWMYYSNATLVEKRKNPRCKVIIEPHGMLDPWAVHNSGWKKKIVGHLFEYRNLRSADCIHALCQSEYESIRRFGLKNPVAIIPNGITLPQTPRYERNHEKKILLFIGRIHPKKGIKELILGLKMIKEQTPSLLNSWEIHIAGWDQNRHLNELKHLVETYSMVNDVKFVGSLYGKAKERALCEANAFILPSFSEGLPMSVLEAWAYELPVVMTDFCNIPEGFSRKCAVRVEPTPNDISAKLSFLFQLSDKELMEIGKRGKKLVSQSFTWEVVAKQHWNCIFIYWIKVLNRHLYMKTDLAHYDNSWYNPGGGTLKRILWYLINVLFFINPFNPFSGIKVFFLRMFGTKVGKGVVIKPSVNIKYPWNLSIGDNSWIGENVWIDNLAQITIGANVCISQGAMLLCGNHNYKKTLLILS